MQQPPPISTLFPYTTLSDLRRREGRASRRRRQPGQHELPDRDDERSQSAARPLVRDDSTGPEPRSQPVGSEGGRAGGTSQDRKSTRLNSSHQIISYAVFCLK